MPRPQHQSWRSDDARPEAADHRPWRTDPDGVLSAEKSGLLMTVHGSSLDGMVRFLVLTPDIPGRRAAILRGSGTEDDIRAAKAAAENMAARVAMWA